MKMQSRYGATGVDKPRIASGAPAVMRTIMFMR
jgi:hypothetical protein